MKNEKAEKLLKDIFLVVQQFNGDYELFRQMMGQYFIDQMKEKS